jgi:hypothetical protein
VLSPARLRHRVASTRITAEGRNDMEELIRSMAEMVNKEEAEGYLVSCCVKDASGNYQIMSGARATEKFTPPYNLYAGLLGKLFHTITQGHPEPQELLQRVLDRAIEEFNETIKDESQSLGEFTIVGKL